MTTLIKVDISANHVEDEELLEKLNKHLEFSYSKESDQIYFSIDIGEDEHFVTLTVDKDELIDAIKRAVLRPED